MNPRDIHHNTQNEGDIAKGIFIKEESIRGKENDMDRIAHAFKISLVKESGYRWT